MMVLSAIRPDAGLLEFLAHRARESSILRLTLNAVAGLVLAVPSVWVRPAGWLAIAALGGVFSFYGAWGLLDRASSCGWVNRVRVGSGIIDALCAFCVAAGIISLSAFLLGVWALALGTWIS